MNKKQGQGAMPAPKPDRWLSAWRLRNAVLVAQTPQATVWRVTAPDGAAAALKVVSGVKKASEAGASEVLRGWNGHGAVRCLASDDRAWLLEWVPGPSLGDLARSGRDGEAIEHLAALTARLHHAPLPASSDLPGLEVWTRALRDYDPDTVLRAESRAALRTAQDWLVELLASRAEDRPLHGDLHHDNVGRAERGWVAFDPKGIRGELAFETANAFRNPIGLEAETGKPARIAAMADAFCAALPVERQRVLKWAAVHCALSIAWGGSSVDDDWRLLPRLLEAAKGPLS